jgi:hypothetical protein
MRKAQFTAIEEFGKDQMVKIIDESFDDPSDIIIYVQSERGEPILEYRVNPSGTIEPFASYPWSMKQQKFFDESPFITQYETV